MTLCLCSGCVKAQKQLVLVYNVVTNKAADGSMSCQKYLYSVVTNTAKNCPQVCCGGSLTNAETQT